MSVLKQSSNSGVSSSTQGLWPLGKTTSPSLHQPACTGEEQRSDRASYVESSTVSLRVNIDLQQTCMEAPLKWSPLYKGLAQGLVGSQGLVGPMRGG